jgi:hypothetical protein
LAHRIPQPHHGKPCFFCSRRFSALPDDVLGSFVIPPFGSIWNFYLELFCTELLFYKHCLFSKDQNLGLAQLGLLQDSFCIAGVIGGSMNSRRLAWLIRFMAREATYMIELIATIWVELDRNWNWILHSV